MNDKYSRAAATFIAEQYRGPRPLRNRARKELANALRQQLNMQQLGEAQIVDVMRRHVAATEKYGAPRTGLAITAAHEAAHAVVYRTAHTTPLKYTEIFGDDSGETMGGGSATEQIPTTDHRTPGTAAYVLAGLVGEVMYLGRPQLGACEDEESLAAGMLNAYCAAHGLNVQHVDAYIRMGLFKALLDNKAVWTRVGKALLAQRRLAGDELNDLVAPVAPIDWRAIAQGRHPWVAGMPMGALIDGMKSVDLSGIRN